MKIAIIGWGSVVWNPRDLPFTGKWSVSGLQLPIEFSRKSKDERLTLVVDFEHGTELHVYVAQSTRKNLDDAVADLRDREKTILARIGFYDALNDRASEPRQSDNKGEKEAHTKVAELVKPWIKNTSYDAAIWTALASNYKDKLDKPFSPDHAVVYLRGLKDATRQLAYDYILRTPETIQTKLRKKWVKEMNQDKSQIINDG